MAPTIPGWLQQRGGKLELASDGRTWVVWFDGQANYSLEAVPVKGKFGCKISQTINGHRVPSEGTFATADAAVAGGLDDLRKALGW
jgi:hypothetical protein